MSSTTGETSKPSHRFNDGTNGLVSNQPGRMDNPLMAVEPPKREDLQPSYAQTLAGESETNQHGWYGSMGMFV